MHLPLDFLTPKERKRKIQSEFLPPVFFVIFFVFKVLNDWHHTKEIDLYLILIHLTERVSFG